MLVYDILHEQDDIDKDDKEEVINTPDNIDLKKEKQKLLLKKLQYEKNMEKARQKGEPTIQSLKAKIDQFMKDNPLQAG